MSRLAVALAAWVLGFGSLATAQEWPNFEIKGKLVAEGKDSNGKPLKKLLEVLVDSDTEEAALVIENVVQGAELNVVRAYRSKIVSQQGDVAVLNIGGKVETSVTLSDDEDNIPETKNNTLLDIAPSIPVSEKIEAVSSCKGASTEVKAEVVVLSEEGLKQGKTLRGLGFYRMVSPDNEQYIAAKEWSITPQLSKNKIEVRENGKLIMTLTSDKKEFIGEGLNATCTTKKLW